MKLRIKYFGVVAEITNRTDEELNFDEDLSLEDVRARCIEKYPKLKSVSFKTAHNQKISDSGRVSSMDEIAFLPPFSGG